jgi:acyl-CoA reductase-like NAD-dependent aldehyde dehydrogenase
LGGLVAEIARGTEPDAAAAVAAAAAQPAWAARSTGERSRALLAVAAVLREHFDEFVALEAAETGKLASHLASEINGSIDYFEYYAAVVRGLRGQSLEPAAGSFAFVRREPYGVVAVVTPWNAPPNQACRESAPALAVGNTVVIKPSEFTSTTTLTLARLATEAGLPPGVLNVVSGVGPEIGEPLLREREVAKIAFTGSVATGRRVAAIGAERIVPVTLELGGKSASIVFADANLEAAARTVATGFTANSGQVCSANTRLLVERSIHDDFVARVTGIVASLKAAQNFGPVITPAQFAKVQEYWEIAEKEGARRVVGGTVAADGDLAKGHYVLPAIYTDVEPSMRLAQEEVFGPVLAVTPFDDEAQAIRLANSTDYGLSSGVWTQNLSRALRVASTVQAGQVSVNGGVVNSETPFGGYRDSGLGRVKGIEALNTSYTQLKTISVGTGSWPWQQIEAFLRACTSSTQTRTTRSRTTCGPHGHRRRSGTSSPRSARTPRAPPAGGWATTTCSRPAAAASSTRPARRSRCSTRTSARA